MSMNIRLIAAVAPIALLAACGGGDKDPATGDAGDPATEQALNDGLMTDPDMAAQNEANAALSGTENAAIPNIDKSPKAIEAAQARAFEMVGGREHLKPAPQARQLPESAPDTPAMIAAAKAAVKPGGANCADNAEYSAAWAAKLPATFPVYPRGNTLEAAGTDQGDCALRIVSFVTPVALDDVLSFYSSRAQDAGFGVEHILKAGDHILSGTKGTSAYVVYGRRLQQGVTQIDLVTTH
jgi:hypothetical protein